MLTVPGAHLHLYGKAPRPGRKVGHVTVRCDDPADLGGRVAALEGLIAGGDPGSSSSRPLRRHRGSSR